MPLGAPIPSKEDTMLSTVNKVQTYHLYHFEVFHTISDFVSIWTLPILGTHPFSGSNLPYTALHMGL